MKACGYLRVSTTEQAVHGLSLEAQRESIAAYAKAQGWEVVAWYEDPGVSGKNPIKKRPAMSRLLKDAETAEWDIVLFIRLDRWFRRVAYYYEAQAVLEKYGKTWATTTEDYNLLTSNGKLLVNMRLAVAQAESDATSDRLKISVAHRVEHGGPMSGRHSLPVGFTVERIEGRAVVAKDEEVREQVEYFLDCVKRSHNIQKSMHKANEKFGRDISYRRYRIMLNSPLLKGEYRRNKQYCEGYMSAEEWAELQEALSRNVRWRKTGRAHIFSGLIACPGCGRKMQAQSVRRYNKAGEELFYDNYLCKRRELGLTGCEFRHCVNEKRIEKQLIERMDEIITERIAEVEIDARTDKERDTEKELRKKEKEAERINELYIKGRIETDKYEKKYSEIEKEIKRLQAVPTKQRDIEKLKKVLESGWKMQYDYLDRERRQEFWRQTLKKIELSEDGKKIKNLEFF